MAIDIGMRPLIIPVCFQTLKDWTFLNLSFPMEFWHSICSTPLFNHTEQLYPLNPSSHLFCSPYFPLLFTTASQPYFINHLFKFN